MRTYKFDSELDSALGSIASDAAIAPEANTKQDVIRRAVALYRYLHVQISGCAERKVAIVENDRVITVIDPLP